MGMLLNVHDGNKGCILTYLEAGTYYVTLKSNNTLAAKPDDIIKLGVLAQYVTRTGSLNGGKVVDAISVTEGIQSEGFVSSSVKKQYFKFTLNCKSEVNVYSKAVNVINPTSCSDIYYLKLLTSLEQQYTSNYYSDFYQPQVTYYKTNGKYVKGQATVRTKVSVIKGNQTYTATVKADGTFSVKTRAVLSQTQFP